MDTSKTFRIYLREAIWEFSLKNTFCNNFLTVRPIFTNSTSIDSALQMQYDKNFAKVSNLNLGEQLGNFRPNKPLQ